MYMVNACKLLQYSNYTVNQLSCQYTTKVLLKQQS